MINTKELRITIGQTVLVWLTVKDRFNEKLIDLTGGRVYVSATADLKVAPLWTLDSNTPNANGTIVIQDQTLKKGQALATMLPAATTGWLPYGDADPYFWDSWAVDSTGAEYPVVTTSRLVVLPTVTRIGS